MWGCEREREREKGNEKIGRKFYKNNHGGGGRDRTIWIWNISKYVQMKKVSAM